MERLWVSGIVLLAGLPLGPALAQAPKAEGLTGSVVTSKGDLPVRDAPPGIFFSSKGDAVGSVTTGTQMRVLEQRTIPTIGGAQQWLRVQPTEPMPGAGGRIVPKEGWIFNGFGSESNVAVQR